MSWNLLRHHVHTSCGSKDGALVDKRHTLLVPLIFQWRNTTQHITYAVLSESSRNFWKHDTTLYKNLFLLTSFSQRE